MKQDIARPMSFRTIHYLQYGSISGKKEPEKITCNAQEFDLEIER